MEKFRVLVLSPVPVSLLFPSPVLVPGSVPVRSSVQSPPSGVTLDQDPMSAQVVPSTSVVSQVRCSPPTQVLTLNQDLTSSPVIPLTPIVI